MIEVSHFWPSTRLGLGILCDSGCHSSFAARKRTREKKLTYAVPDSEWPQQHTPTSGTPPYSLIYRSTPGETTCESFTCSPQNNTCIEHTNRKTINCISYYSRKPSGRLAPKLFGSAVRRRIMTSQVSSSM